MNIGLYSFERLEIKKLEGISNKIKTKRDLAASKTPCCTNNE